MNLFDTNSASFHLPILGAINTEQLWQDIHLQPICMNFKLLCYYVARHDAWTGKLRRIELDRGLLVRPGTLLALDVLLEHLCVQARWGNPEIYVVADIGRKGIHSWCAVSVVRVVSNSKPIILLGVELVKHFDVQEFAFVIGHETGHLPSYNNQWRDDISLNFLVQELYESNRIDELNEIQSNVSWKDGFQRIMLNARAIESRCELLGFLVCGSIHKAGTTLLSATLKNRKNAQQIERSNYFSVHVPMLSASPVLGSFSVNAGHPFVPYRINALAKFVNDSELE